MPAGAKLIDHNRFVAEPKASQKTQLFKTAQHFKQLDHGRPFFIEFREHPNLLNCNRHNVKTLLFSSSGLSFWHRKSIKIHVFSRSDPGAHFSSFYWLPCQTTGFWTSFKIKWAPIGDQNRTCAPKCCKNLMSPWTRVRPWNRLVLQKPPKRHRGSFWMTCC